MKKIKMKMLKPWGPFVPGEIVPMAESKAKWAIGDGVAEKYKVSKAELKAKADAEAKERVEAENAMVEPIAETADIRPFTLDSKKKRGK